MEDSGRNRIPEKLKPAEREVLFAACDSHLQTVIKILEPEWMIGVGKFAENRAKRSLEGMNVKIGTILHPSPASPAANQNWTGKAAAQLMEQGVWV